MPLIVTSWHRSSIPRSPCKTLSLPTANALTTTLQHNALGPFICLSGDLFYSVFEMRILK